ncbi:hypothetical protein [Pectinatus frisingensis]|uniref:hypothetical protein n=1 Tax=Pectinatus frisingensis TaxID=865 RepID=UPI003D8024C9
MKKMAVLLCLTLLLVFGTVPAMAASAASPFSNVPKDSWVYQAVSDLVKADVIDSSSEWAEASQNGKILTRYSVAQIVANAMTYKGDMDPATKATLAKLSTEFSSELNMWGISPNGTNIGVQNSQSNQNTKKPNIQFYGDTRIRYQNNYGLIHPALSRLQLRLRLGMTADVNDHIKFDGLISQQNTNGLSGDSTAIGSSGVAQLTRANFTFDNVIKHGNMTLGRMGLTLGATGLAYDIPTGWFDGIKFTGSGKDVQWLLGYGDNGSQGENGNQGVLKIGAAENWAPQPLSVGQLAWTANKNVKLYAAGMIGNSNSYRIKDEIIGTNISYKTFTLTGDYIHNAYDFKASHVDPDAYYLKLAYKGASMSNPGSWGLYADYRKVGGQSIDIRTTTLNVGGTTPYPGYTKSWDGLTVAGLKGPGFGFSYTFAKNAMLTGAIEYLKSYDGSINYHNFNTLVAYFAF